MQAQLRYSSATELQNILVVAATEAVYALPVESIIRIQALSNYSKIYLTNKRIITVSKVLFWFQQQSCMQSFIRIHRTHLINKKFIAQYQCISNAASFVHLTSGEKISISRRRKQLFKKVFCGCSVPIHNLGFEIPNTINSSK
jgi:two-component system, LytTR family, response regulator